MRRMQMLAVTIGAVMTAAAGSWLTAGLAAVIAHSVHWMTAIKLLGGAYLLYLGIKGLRARAGAPDPGQARDLPDSAWRQVLGGFLCNAFNPKAPIYFLALFTVVLSPGLPLPTLLAYGAWIMLLQWLWFSLVATVFAHRAVRDRLFAVRHWIDRAFGVAMVALGARVLISARE
jgi:threonine/homoserine/homoserine lactone efflux protein